MNDKNEFSDLDCYDHVSIKMLLQKERLGIDAIYLCKIMTITG